jgi:Ca2+-binding RTX toxin-like protein
MATISGTENNDTLIGGAEDDTIDGLAGNDSIDGGAGDDFLIGGTGTDTYVGGEGYDTVLFEDATQGVSANLVTGVIQDDGFGNAETISEVEGINGSHFDDVLNAGGGYVIGRAGDDNLTANWVNGGSGNDTLVGSGSGANLDYWDDGFDPEGVFAQGVVVNLTTGSATDNWGNTDLISGFANVSGSFYADQITGDTSANDLFGDSGNDTLDGGAGDDFLIGGTGTDTYTGGEGYDTVWFGDATQGVRANLVTGVIQNDGFGNAETISGVEGINGSRFGDVLNAGEEGYVIGSAGNDNLTANWVNGGSGNDTLVGSGSDAHVDFWDNGFDPAGVTAQGVVVNLITGIATDNWGKTDRLSGFTHVAGSLYADRITGNSGNNDLFGDSGNDILDGGAGSDYLDGWDGNDYLIGGAGNDYLSGGAGNDTMLGGTGSDTFESGAGNDTMNGGAITDPVNLSDLNLVTYAFASLGIVLNLQTGIAQDGDGGTDTLVNINFVEGSDFDDRIIGTVGTLFEQFEGLAGNDTIDGGAITASNNGFNRVTYLQAPAGIDANLATGVVQDGYGDTDTLFNIQSIRGSTHDDTMVGSDTDAWTEVFEGRAGDDTIDGAGGIDMVRFDAATNGVNVDFTTGIALDGQGGIDTLSNVEGVRGSSHADTLTGGNVANDDFEFFQGGAGNDTIDGGTGYDRADYTTALAAATVTLGGTGNGTALDGQGGTDTLTNVEAVRGSSFNDRLTGSDSGVFESFEGMAGNDTIDGKGGIDRADYVGSVAGVQASLLTGVASDGFGGTDRLLNIEDLGGSSFGDTLTGNAGVNRIDGRDGNDRIDGKGGVDTLDGGRGADVYLVASASEHMAAEFVDSGNEEGLFDGVWFTATTAGTLTLFAGDTGLEIASLASAARQITGTTALNIDASAVGNAMEILGNNGANQLTGTAFNDTILGNGGNDRLDGRAGDDHLWGGTGNDTYVVDSLGDLVLEEGASISEIDTVEASISWTLSTNLERLTLTGSDDLDGTGNTRANTLTGNSGANELNGEGGNDSLVGGAGNDTLNGGIGNDTMFGGAGDETYMIDSVLDKVYESTTTSGATDAGGTDTVLSSVNYTLSNFVENLELVVGIGNINGTGNALANEIIGNEGSNVIDGKGGVDTLDGGAESDIYLVAVAADHAAAEFGDTGEGGDIDEVRFTAGAASTMVLFAGDTGIERVVIGTGSAPSAVSSGTIALNVDAGLVDNALTMVGNNGANTLAGTAYADTILGNGGSDRLDGGEGADTMTGGSGNDTYVVDVAGDLAVEAGTLAGGIDTVESSIISVVLNDVGANLENITLIGSSDIDGIGNDVANTIKGNSGANELVGGLGNDNLSGAAGNDTLDGEIGNDTLLGGAGDDTYVVDVVTDRVYETTTAISTTDAGGVDLVLSGVNWTLGSFVENLTLTGGGNTRGTGNVLGNHITGNSGNNVINGAAGNDSLNGGAGDDIFRFASTLNAATNRDTIEDFAPGDKLQLENAIFTRLTTLGTLNTVNFVSGAGVVAVDANDFILYDTNTGVLSYDRDGNGAALAVTFAELIGQPALTAGDFIVT